MLETVSKLTKCICLFSYHFLPIPGWVIQRKRVSFHQGKQLCKKQPGKGALSTEY